MFNVSLFPNISKELFKKFNIHYVFTYNYKYNGGYNELRAEKLSNSLIKLEDIEEIEDWDFKEHGFNINGYIKLSYAYKYILSNKIVVKNTKVGVALCWSSAESKQRGIVDLGILGVQKDDIFNFELKFQPNQLLGKVKLELIFYIHKSGDAYPNEKHIANSIGTKLGVFSLLSIQLEGIGSLFPIFIEEDPNGPLYNLSLDINDPFQDAFTDVIKLKLNKLHPAFMYIDITQKDFYNKSFFSEVMASSMATLIMYLSYEGFLKDLDNNTDYEEGSVMHVVHYFIEKLEWDFSSFESINSTIRKYLDKEF